MKVAYKKFACNRCFGVELEASNTVKQSFIKKVIENSSPIPTKMSSGWQLSKGNKFWHVKKDSTCGVQGKGKDKGWEIASYKGSTVSDIIHMAEIAENLRLAGLEVNNNCGLHVHVEVKDYTTREMGKLIGYWLKIEDILMESVPFRRSLSHYCNPLRANRPRTLTPTPDQLWSHHCPICLSPFENPERWMTLNLVNYATGLLYKNYSRTTVEFRFPEGTLVQEDVKNWIRLFVHFVDVVKTLPDPESILTANLEEALSILGLHHTEDTFNIFSKGLFETRAWFLRRILRYGWAKLRRNRASEILDLMLSEGNR
jgi:hypothetical protein